VAPRLPEQRFAPGQIVRGPTSLENAINATIDQRLAFPLAELKLQSVPLAKACNQLGQVAGIGCTLDPWILEIAAVRPDRTLSLESKSTTIGSTLQRFATGLKLELQPGSSGVTFAKPAAAQRRTVEYEVADLSGSGGSQSLADLVTQVIEADWAAGTIVSQAGKISIDQPLATQYRVLRFLERLRLARGLTTASRYPAKLLTTSPRFAQVSESLKHPTTFTFVDYTPLPQALAHIEGSSGLIFLVDWQHSFDHGVSPTTLVAGSVSDVPLGEALDQLCAPLELVWMPLDDRTIWMTPVTQRNTYAWVEYYESDQLAVPSAALLRERLDEMLPNNLLASAVIVDDPPSGTIIVRAASQVHRAIASLLRN
jgi:hypothetical protein